MKRYILPIFFCLLFLGWTNDNYFKTDIKDFEYFASWAENLDTHPSYTPEEEYSRLLQELEKSELKEVERTEIRDIAGCVVSLNVSLNYINKNDN